MRHLRELDRLGEELAVLDRDIADATDDPAVRRLLTIAGVNLTVAAGLVAAIGDIRRFPRPQQLVSYFGLNPRVQALLTRNGAAFLGQPMAGHGAAGLAGRNLARLALAVSEGDIFELSVWHSAGASLNVEAGSQT